MTWSRLTGQRAIDFQRVSIGMQSIVKWSMTNLLMGCIAWVLYGPVFAQVGEKGLVGIALAQLVVEQLNADATACGITSDSLDAAMRIPISNSKLELGKTSAVSPYLYANVLAVKDGSGRCAVYVELSLVRYARFAPGAGIFEGSLVTVWSRGSLLTGPASGMGHRVTNELEGKTKQFLGAWLKAN